MKVKHLSFVLLFALACVLATDLDVIAKHKYRTDPERWLKNTYPNLSYSSVAPTEIPGIYQVITKPKRNIIYFSPTSGHLIFGEIWKDGKSLTKQVMQELISLELDKLPLGLALRLGPENGTKQIIEITDPDCPYCRKGSVFLDNYTEVTRYIFFYPLSIHPQANAKARFILSSDNPAQTYHEVMAGKYDKSSLPVFNDNGVLDAHISLVKKIGVNQTPSYWVETVPVSGADTAKLRALIEKQVVRNDKNKNG